MNNTDNDLARQLARKADQFGRHGGTELEIGQVLARAGEIRRGRRMRATLVMAAAVIAIAVPTALIAVNRDQAQEPTPAPAPKVDESPLTIDGLERGGEPGTGYAKDGSLYDVPEAFTPTAGDRLVSFAAFDGGVVVATSTDTGDWSAHLDGAGGTTWPMTGAFQVSDGGDLVAFVEPDGTPIVVTKDGTAHKLPKIPEGTGFTAVAVDGTDCQESGDATCSVSIRSTGEHPDSWVSASTDLVAPSEEFQSLVDVYAGKYIAGITELTDTGTCSAVKDVNRVNPTWDTCDHSLLAFSPDGEHLLGTAAQYDGEGMPRLTVLGSKTGEVVLDLTVAEQGVITAMIWEDSEHVLAVVRQGDQSAILRIGLDGSREYAVPPTGVDADFMTPFQLPSR